MSWLEVWIQDWTQLSQRATEFSLCFRHRRIGAF
jgi:hypothetical protein